MGFRTSREIPGRGLPGSDLAAAVGAHGDGWRHGRRLADEHGGRLSRVLNVLVLSTRDLGGCVPRVFADVPVVGHVLGCADSVMGRPAQGVAHLQGHTAGDGHVGYALIAADEYEMGTIVIPDYQQRREGSRHG